jgi:hypothetical protein
MFLDYFDAWMLKMIFFFKKYYFNTFTSEKYFEKQPQPHFQTRYNISPQILLYFTISIIIQPLLYFSGNAWYLKPIRHGLFRFSKKKQQYHIIS